VGALMPALARPRAGLRSLLRRVVPSEHPIARAAGRIENDLFKARAAGLVRGALAEVAVASLPADARTILSLDRTGTRVAVARVGRAGAPPAALAMVSQTDAGSDLLHRQADAERRLRADPRLAGWAALVPEPLAAGAVRGHAFLVERALPGSSPLARIAEPARRVEVVEQAATVIAGLHSRTASPVAVDAARVEEWVRDRVRTVATGLSMAGPDRGRVDALARTERELIAAYLGREMTVSWIHGDYWPGNLLLDGVGAIVGIVDWDRAAPGEPPILDILHLLLYTRRVVTGVEPGRLVAEAMSGDPWPPSERRLLASTPGGGFLRDPRERRATLLLYWLRFVAASFEQADWFARNRRWVASNVDPVLGAR
jgi:hypothetical protein